MRENCQLRIYKLTFKVQICLDARRCAISLSNVHFTSHERKSSLQARQHQEHISQSKKKKKTRLITSALSLSACLYSIEERVTRSLRKGKQNKKKYKNKYNAAAAAESVVNKKVYGEVSKQERERERRKQFRARESVIRTHMRACFADARLSVCI